ncbi:hypothetical protein C0V97_04185 [Asaia sp. W19]|nr:hypothetical protein C0V97_04185 [Asaia sp. W19]
MRAGYEAWVTRGYGGDGKSLSLSKARLGEFMAALIKFGGDIHGIFSMHRTYPRAYVQASISLPVGMSEKFTEETGFALQRPPTFNVGPDRSRKGGQRHD